MGEINGDDPLGPLDRIRYVCGNLFANLTDGLTSLDKRPYSPEHLENGHATASPSRALTETFIVHELPKLFPVRPIRILDVGCGSGGLSNFIEAAGYSGEYVGIDVGNRFQNVNGADIELKRSFIQTDAHNYHPDQPFDMIISFSALEHIDDDKSLITGFSSMLNSGGIQLHIVPSPWGLFLYLWHGYRQYGLGRLRRRFGVEGTHIISLGGPMSTILHFLYITFLEMICRVPARRWFPGPYRFMRKCALISDRHIPCMASAYVVYKSTNRDS